MSNTAQSTNNSQVDDPDDICAVDEELELLRSIYVHELNVTNDENGRPHTVSIDLHPATADKAEEQFVRLNLVFTLPQLYPRALPEITLRNSRGISDEDLKKIHSELKNNAEQQKSSQSLYALIEHAKEHLTAKNTPTGICAICLYGFDPKDVFTKTECYHYFHARCLGRYVKSTLEQTEDGNSKVFCPVCRELISYELAILECAPQPIECESAADFEITDELKQLQGEMAGLFQRQLSRGGIIDLEAEKNKFLLEISTIAPTEQRSVTSIDNANSIGAATNSKNESNESLPIVINPDSYQGKGNQNKSRGRGKGASNSNTERRRPEQRDSAEAIADNPISRSQFESPTLQDKQKPFPRIRGRGRGRSSGLSWHQQNRRAKNLEKRDVEDSLNQLKETKNTELTHKTSNEGKSIKSNESWGYGPPPLGFSKDATHASPRNFTRATPIAPPPGFRSRPPFPPRAKPPPGFLPS